MTTRSQINELLQTDPDRFSPAFAAVQLALDGIPPASLMNGVHPALVGAMLPLMIQGSVLSEDPETIALIEAADGGWQAYGYEDAADYASAQTESLAIIRAVVPDDVLDLLAATAEAFVDAVKDAEPAPADHPDVQVQPQVSVEELLSDLFGGDVGIEIVNEDSSL